VAAAPTKPGAAACSPPSHKPAPAVLAPARHAVSWLDSGALFPWEEFRGTGVIIMIMKRRFRIERDQAPDVPVETGIRYCG
jgi:hypothetical protein